VAVGDAAVADLGRVAAEAAVAFTRRVMDSQGAWPSWQWAFRLAQLLQGIPGILDGLEAEPEAFRPASDAFWLAMERTGVIGGFEKGWLDGKWIELLDVWGEVRVPGATGSNLLRGICDEALRQPIELLPPFTALGWRFRLVMSVAFYLQKYQGNLHIMLPQKTLARWLRVHQTVVSHIVRLATKRKLLRCVDPHWSYRKRRAKAYAFNLRAEGTFYRQPQGATGGEAVGDVNGAAVSLGVITGDYVPELARADGGARKAAAAARGGTSPASSTARGAMTP